MTQVAELIRTPAKFSIEFHSQIGYGFALVVFHRLQEIIVYLRV